MTFVNVNLKLNGEVIQVFKVIKDKVGAYIDPEEVLYATKQTKEIGCVYAPIPEL